PGEANYAIVRTARAEGNQSWRDRLAAFYGDGALRDQTFAAIRRPAGSLSYLGADVQQAGRVPGTLALNLSRGMTCRGGRPWPPQTGQTAHTSYRPFAGRRRNARVR